VVLLHISNINDEAATDQKPINNSFAVIVFRWFIPVVRAYKVYR